MNLERASNHLKVVVDKESDGRVEEIACVSNLLFNNGRGVLRAEVASKVGVGQLTFDRVGFRRWQLSKPSGL